MNLVKAILNLLYEFFLGCRHDHLTRPFTLGERTYKVCLDCGRHVFYSAETMQPLRGHALQRTQAMLTGEVKLVSSADTAQPLNKESSSEAAA